MGKGEIARYEQFLFFPRCFQKACFPGASKGVIMWEWVNQRPVLTTLQGKSPLENLWKEEKMAITKSFSEASLETL